MQVVRFPDGTEVRGGGLDDREECPVDVGVYMHAGWGDGAPTIEWPDFGLPADEEGAFSIIRRAFAAAQSGGVVEVGCAGGMGRTGTVLACMATLAGVGPEDAVAWVRRNYRSEAIETDAQEGLVLRFAGRA